MFKFLKYDLKGSFRTFLYLFILGFLVSFALEIFTTPEELSQGLIVFTWTIVCISSLVLIISNFKQSLYSDQAYLNFTLPLSGKKFLLSKMLHALIWMIASIIIYYLSIISLINKAVPFVEVKEILLNTFRSPDVAIIIILYSIFTILSFVLTVYFSITLTKITFKAKRLSSFVAFITFIIINSSLVFFDLKILKYLPYDLTLKISSLEHAMTSNFISNGASSVFQISRGYVSMNLFTLIFNLIVFVGMFFLTSYIIEKKIDV